MNENRNKTAILHVALNPLTGPWAVMKQLAKAQAATGLAREVALGLITDASWPRQYEEELRDLGLRVFRKHTPKMFGTASVLWQYLFPPGIDRWAETLARETGAGRIVVHSHNAWMSGVYLPIRSRGNYSVQVVVTFHGVNPILAHQPLRGAIHRWMAHRLVTFGATLTAVDAGSVVRAETVLGMPKEPFSVIPNGVSCSATRACPFLRGAEKFTVAHIGTINEDKGWQIAAQAVERLSGDGVPVRLLLAGRGPQEKKAKQWTSRLPGVVQYLGYVSDPRQNLMPQCDLMSLMTANDALPMAIMEAMSVGLPIAATAIGGIPSAITDGETGFLVDRSSEALAEKIRLLCCNPSILSRLSTATLQRFAENFEIGAVARRYLDVYGVTSPPLETR
jgi:glycosyltransferase involved in cell wall biosynthesis